MAGFIGNQIGGTPALLLPDGKGRRRGGENPAGGARGGWRCEGGRDIFLLRSQEVLNTFNFAASILFGYQEDLFSEANIGS